MTGRPMFHVQVVDAHVPAVAEVLSNFNDLFLDEFDPLEREHFEQGQWSVVTTCGPRPELVAFAGSVPFHPFDNFLYFKRVAVVADYRGQGLQRALMQVAEAAAREAGYTHMISTTYIVNIHSANNFVKTGWRLCKPEKPWEPRSLYWVKKL